MPYDSFYSTIVTRGHQLLLSPNRAVAVVTSSSLFIVISPESTYGILKNLPGIHKNLYIYHVLLTIFGPINYGPP